MQGEISNGITVGAKTTIETPDGSKVVGFGVRLTAQGIALGMTTELKGERKEYAATIDAQSLAEYIGYASYFVGRLIRGQNPKSATSAEDTSNGNTTEENRYT
jgi:hypothetical protein